MGNSAPSGWRDVQYTPQRHASSDHAAICPRKRPSWDFDNWGLDSRTMMACLNPKPGELPCYTFGGAKDVLDILIARQVSELYGQNYYVIRLGDGLFSLPRSC